MNTYRKSIRKIDTRTSNKRKVIVFTSELESETEIQKRVTQASAAQRLLRIIGVKSSEVSVDQITDNIKVFLSNVQEILAKSANQYHEFKMDSVEVEAQISGDGQIGFMGTHVGMSGSAGIRFVFRRMLPES